MNLRTSIAAAILAGAVAVSPAAFAEVSIVQLPSPALARASTYAWAPIWGVAVGSPAPAVVNEITAQQLQAATDSALGQRGYQRVERPSEADLIVSYGVMTAPRVDGELDDLGRGAPWFDSVSRDRLRVSQKTRGTLVLDLTERRTGRLVYRATSEKDITGRDVEPKRLHALLNQMTKSLPTR
jgi:hypothetical protein